MSSGVLSVDGLQDLSYDFTLTDNATGLPYTAGTVSVALCARGTVAPLGGLGASSQALTHVGAGRWTGTHDLANVALAVANVTMGAFFDLVLVVTGDASKFIQLCQRVPIAGQAYYTTSTSTPLVPPALSQTPQRYSSSDLVLMCKEATGRPTVDAQMDDTAWYRLLTAAQDQFLGELAVRVPTALDQQYATLPTTDGGKTYTFGYDVYGEPVVPFGHVEVWAKTNGRTLFASSYEGRGGDFVIEGSVIRMPGGIPRTFTEGPFARWTSVAPAITATFQPIVQPRPMRALLVHLACMAWAERGGRRDPAPYINAFRRGWLGDPTLGILGWCGTLQTRFVTGMVPASGRPSTLWWQTPEAMR